MQQDSKSLICLTLCSFVLPRFTTSKALHFRLIGPRLDRAMVEDTKAGQRQKVLAAAGYEWLKNGPSLQKYGLTRNQIFQTLRQRSAASTEIKGTAKENIGNPRPEITGSQSIMGENSRQADWEIHRETVHELARDSGEAKANPKQKRQQETLEAARYEWLGRAESRKAYGKTAGQLFDELNRGDIGSKAATKVCRVSKRTKKKNNKEIKRKLQQHSRDVELPTIQLEVDSGSHDKDFDESLSIDQALIQEGKKLSRWGYLAQGDGHERLSDKGSNVLTQGRTDSEPVRLEPQHQGAKLSGCQLQPLTLTKPFPFPAASTLSGSMQCVNCGQAHERFSINESRDCLHVSINVSGHLLRDDNMIEPEVARLPDDKFERAVLGWLIWDTFEKKKKSQAKPLSDRRHGAVDTEEQDCVNMHQLQCCLGEGHLSTFMAKNAFTAWWTEKFLNNYDKDGQSVRWMTIFFHWDVSDDGLESNGFDLVGDTLNWSRDTKKDQAFIAGGVTPD